MNRLRILLCFVLTSAAACSSLSGTPRAVFNQAAAQRERETLSAAVVKPDAASPSPTPSPIYTYTAPYGNYVAANPSKTPLTFTVKSGGTVSVVASYKCRTTTSGGTIIDVPNSWYLEGGLCNGGTNPTDATGTHFYDVANGIQAVPSTGLTSGTSYLVAGVANGSNLQFYMCSPGCTATSITDAKVLATAATTGFIGAAAPSTRISLADVWNVKVFNFAMTQAQVQTLANAAPVDPIATPTPIPGATYVAIAAGDASPAGNYQYDFTNPTTYAAAQPETNPVTVSTSGVTNPAPQAVYQHDVSGTNLQYDIPGLAANTTYPVRMHFVEDYNGSAGSRVFSVLNNGETVISNLDIYAVAGAKNKAITESFNGTTNPYGHLVLSTSSTASEPIINGIEINPQLAPAATPSPNPSPTYPILSSMFTGSTPFHKTVAQLIAAGAVLQSSTIAANLTNQGIGSGGEPYNDGADGASAMYVAHSGDPDYTFGCPEYGGCSYAGGSMHCPRSATPSGGSDHHLTCIDTVIGGEIDGYGGDGTNCGNESPVDPTSACTHPCDLVPGSGGSNGTADCSYGGFFAFSGNGLGQGANHAGFAYGEITITAGDILGAGPITHALGLIIGCADSPGVYPGPSNSDSPCSGSGSQLEPNAVYGQLVTINPSANISSYGYTAGSPCAKVVAALQTYGAYVTDTNAGGGLALEFENPAIAQYPTDPWGTVIFPQMVAAGDATFNGYSAPFKVSYQACLQRVNPSDVQVYNISSSS